MSMAFPLPYLNAEDNEKLKKAISWITVLIAAADGKIDTNETAWAAKLAKIRTYTGEESLREYYMAVGDTFQHDLNALIRDMPTNTDERSRILADRLTEINEIFDKMPTKVSSLFYRDFRSFAAHVAKASGGFLGFFSIGPGEKRWLDLPMINEVHYYEDEEE
jgi:hypothetical protein